MTSLRGSLTSGPNLSANTFNTWILILRTKCFEPNDADGITNACGLVRCYRKVCLASSSHRRSEAEAAALDEDPDDDEHEHGADDDDGDHTLAEPVARDLHARVAGVGGDEVRKRHIDSLRANS